LAAFKVSILVMLAAGGAVVGFTKAVGAAAAVGLAAAVGATVGVSGAGA
jgi:hypothetical protein